MEFEHFVAQWALRPEDVLVTESDEYLPVLSAYQVGQFDANTVAFVPGAAVLLGLWLVLPPSSCKR